MVVRCATGSTCAATASGPSAFPSARRCTSAGWYCWKEHHADEGEGLPDVPLPFEVITDAASVADLVDQALELYDAWKKDDRQHKVFTVMQRNLRRGRADMVHEFLKQVHRDDRVGAFLKRFTTTEEWRRWTRRATRKRKP